MSDTPALDNPLLESLVADVADEFLERRKRGEQPDIDEYTRRYPQAAAVLRDVLASLQVIGAGSDARGTCAVDQESVAGCLGDFRILREAGRGGMGIVYEAEQISLGRRVALKVLPFAATLDPKQLQRFKNEAQAAAQLHHTNIVPIHFVGTDRGVHFYAMQFIDGQSLAQVIADLRLQIADCRKDIAPASKGEQDPETTEIPAIADQICNLQSAICNSTQHALFTETPAGSPAYFRTVARLGVQAALALEHAHEMGVIHRDIKPGNLLVDARGNLWITDFGLAHMHGDPKLTITGDLVGTVRYMSPEQALGNRAEVDRGTDIYSLGATLYELMTLEPVFPGQQRRELLEQIGKDDPKPPRRINPATPIDLETIVLKALAKNPRERYATAQELAGDLQRFLEDRPIQARRPTLRQRAARWARRHVVLVRAAAIVLMLAVVGLAAGTALIWRSQQQTEEALVRAEHSQQQTEEALVKAESSQQQTEEALVKAGRSQQQTQAALIKAERMQRLAESAVNDMYTEVAEKWLEHEPLSDPLQRKFLLKALEYFKEFARENSNCPQLARQTALAYKRAGVIQYKLGHDAEAEANLAEAMRLFQSLAADSTSHLRDLASCHNARAIVMTRAGNLRQAEQDYCQARDILERLRKPAPDDPALQSDLARYRVHLAVFLTSAGRFSEAEREFTQALDMDSRLASRHAGVPAYRFGLANTQHNRGILFWRTGRLDEAEKAWKEAIRLAAELSTADPRRHRYRETLVHGHGNLAALHYSAGRLREAEKVLLESLPLQQKLAEDFPHRVDYQEELAGTFYRLGLIQGGNGARDKAEKAYRHAAKLFRALLARSPRAVPYQTQLASTLNNLANLLKDTGRFQEAEPTYRDALALLEAQPEDCRKEPGYRDELTIYLNNLGYLYWRTGKPQQAEPLLARAVKLRQELVTDLPAMPAYRDKLVGTHVNLAWLLKQAGKTGAAEQQFRAAVTHAQKLAADIPQLDQHKSLARRNEALARLLWDAGRFPEAKETFRAARKAWEKGLEREPENSVACHLLARFLADCPDRDSADPIGAVKLAQKALTLAAKPPGEFWITLGLAHHRAGDWKAALAALGKAGSVAADEACLRDFLQAMAHARLGNGELAGKCYDRAVAALDNLWMKEDDLQQRRREAELVLPKKAGRK
jgi:serine/threonine protein kinase/Flp pilus assembly protein TadD